MWAGFESFSSTETSQTDSIAHTRTPRLTPGYWKARRRLCRAVAMRGERRFRRRLVKAGHDRRACGRASRGRASRLAPPAATQRRGRPCLIRCAALAAGSGCLRLRAALDLATVFGSTGGGSDAGEFSTIVAAAGHRALAAAPHRLSATFQACPCAVWARRARRQLQPRCRLGRAPMAADGRSSARRPPRHRRSINAFRERPQQRVLPCGTSGHSALISAARAAGSLPMPVYSASHPGGSRMLRFWKSRLVGIENGPV